MFQKQIFVVVWIKGFNLQIVLSESVFVFLHGPSLNTLMFYLSLEQGHLGTWVPSVMRKQLHWLTTLVFLFREFRAIIVKMHCGIGMSENWQIWLGCFADLLWHFIMKRASDQTKKLAHGQSEYKSLTHRRVSFVVRNNSNKTVKRIR